MATLDNLQHERLSRLLGRPILDEAGSCASFDHLMASHLDDLVTLARSGTMIQAVLYVRHLLPPDQATLANAVSFLENVICKNLSLSEWLEHHHRPG